MKEDLKNIGKALVLMISVIIFAIGILFRKTGEITEVIGDVLMRSTT